MIFQHVLVFGTFDGLHDGHLYFLKNAKSRGKILTVVVALDSHVQQLKSKEPQYTEQERKKTIETLTFVDETVFSDNELGTFQVVSKRKPDLILLGHDQVDLAEAIKAWMKSNQQNVRLEFLDKYIQKKCENCNCHS